MGITDKVTGKAKQAVGDLTGSASTRREGQQEEVKGEKKEEAARAHETAEAKERQAENLEQKTS